MSKEALTVALVTIVLTLLGFGVMVGASFQVTPWVLLFWVLALVVAIVGAILVRRHHKSGIPPTDAARAHVTVLSSRAEIESAENIKAVTILDSGLGRIRVQWLRPINHSYHASIVVIQAVFSGTTPYIEYQDASRIDIQFRDQAGAPSLPQVFSVIAQ